jgi:hypothetical protein
MELHELKIKDIQLEERIRINEADQSAVKDDLTATKDDLISTKDGLAATKEDLTCTKEDLTMNDHEMEREVSFLKNPPFFHACGYKDGTTVTRQTIPYSSLPLPWVIHSYLESDCLWCCRVEYCGDIPEKEWSEY